MAFKNTNTSQIENLHEIYNNIFPDNTNGKFIEIGAYDGYRWSNTVPLIQEGWSGVMIEPVPRYYNGCKDRYLNNPKIQVYNCCIGKHNNPQQKVYLGGPCTTILENMVELSRNHDPRDGHDLNNYIESPCYTLDTFLHEKNIQNFDLLSIDVEGAEWDILINFDIKKYNPKMAIVEVHEKHHLSWKRESGNFELINKYFIDNGYTYLYGDDINSIWVLN